MFGKKKPKEEVPEPEEFDGEDETFEEESEHEEEIPTRKPKQAEQPQLRIITENQLIIGMLQEILAILKK